MIVVCVGIAAALCAVAAVLVSWWWTTTAVVLAALSALGTWDLVQTRHTILRVYPILGHVRFLMKLIRPEIAASRGVPIGKTMVSPRPAR